MEQTWIGEGAPLGASKAMIEAYRNRLDQTPKNGDIDITVICNDVSMGSERDIVNDVYGSRDDLPFDVKVYRELGTAELRNVLSDDADFLHYIGHIDSGGFECMDGRLDAGTLDATGITSFFLNACTSYDQGMKLIEAGSLGGVVTLQDVINSGAERIGKSLAKLLNLGFPLRAALNIAKRESIMGGHYLVIGDGNLDIAQSESLMPVSYELKETRDGYMLKQVTYPNRECGIGTIAYPFIDSDDECYLASGQTTTCHLTDDDELHDILSSRNVPVYYKGELSWSFGVKI